MKRILFILVLTASINVYGQTGKIRGNAIFKAGSTALVGATILIDGTERETNIYEFREYKIPNLNDGSYNLIVKSFSFGTETIYNVLVQDNKVTNVNVALPPRKSYDQYSSKKCPVDNKSQSVIPISYGLTN